MTAARNGSQALEIHTRAWRALAWTHLTVRGSLDRRTCTQLLDAVTPTLEPGHRTTLDLFEVAAVDSAGAQAIRDCEVLAGERDAELTVEDPSPAVRRGLSALS
jgi:anti-anti-sigma regulatory factor